MSHGSSCCSRLSTFPRQSHHSLPLLLTSPPPLLPLPSLVFGSDFETYRQTDSFFLFFLLFPSCKPRSCLLSVLRLLPRLDLHDILHLPKLVYVYQHCINSLGHTSTSTSTSTPPVAVASILSYTPPSVRLTALLPPTTPTSTLDLSTTTNSVPPTPRPYLKVERRLPIPCLVACARLPPCPALLHHFHHCLRGRPYPSAISIALPVLSLSTILLSPTFLNRLPLP
ncbi:hypothetical protein BP00DRAFT_249168 [Aspergillus indologenus CBS 114.80]|uniref:Uncharacterized protein n=1 Tax=Aspergillus indologenus CBS 114.80 TaxID=1450541 RepID=A0A2V5I1K6_9EURO|nr:hypothetical protein BP00DRAFT_249168 [Aspergillus indologenus CBS 114.80]